VPEIVISDRFIRGRRASRDEGKQAAAIQLLSSRSSFHIINANRILYSAGYPGNSKTGEAKPILKEQVTETTNVDCTSAIQDEEI
jgi:hypothetical protein